MDLFAVCVGQINIASEMFFSIDQQLGGIAGPRNHGSIVNTLFDVVNGYRRERFQREVVETKFA
jgi:hypothetical protein